MVLIKAKTTDFLPDKKNANRGTVRGAAMLDASLREDGAARSIVVDADNNIVAGNKTLERAVDAGITDAVIIETTGNELVVVKRKDWKLYEQEAPRRYAYRDNRSGELSLDWDALQIAADLEAGLNLDGLFNPDELSAILEAAGTELLGGNGTTPTPESQTDRAEELQAKWQVKPGDIWQIANHFVICGDCREADTWKRLLAAAGVEKVNGVFTSPPYAEQRKQQYGGVPTGEYVQWWEAVQGNVKANLAGDGSFFVNIKPHCEDGQRVLYVFDLVLAMVRAWGWKFVDEFTWLRPALPGGWENRFKNGFEPVYHFCLNQKIRFNPGAVAHKSDSAFVYGEAWGKTATGSGAFKDANRHSGEAYPDNVLELRGTAENIPHSAQFPISLPTFFVKAYSDSGDVWLDPFLGSGTTICAAHNEGRRGLGIEKLEKYCAVILERLQDLTHKTPELLTG